MPALFALLLLAVSVKQENTALRDGCDDHAATLTTLPAGASVTVRYALSGAGASCYKVSVDLGGKAAEGFLTSDALQGLETFEQGLRAAPWLDLTEAMGAVRTTTANNGASLQSVMQTASSLIESSRPGKALELLESQTEARKNPGLLALAGVAAWRGDDDRKALEFWRASLDLQPNQELETLYRRVEHEANADHSTEKLYGVRVALRYETSAVSADTARQMVAAVDHEFARISADLGCGAEERIAVIAQSPEAYRKTTDAAEWNSGQFDGRIRVPIFENQGLDAALRRTLAHETTHACLSMLGRWPAWFQEGMAQKLSGDAVTPALRQKLTEWAREGRVPRLSNLGQDWSRLDAQHALVAYGLSLAAVELFYQEHGTDGMRNLLRNPDRLPAATAELDKRLGLN